MPGASERPTGAVDERVVELLGLLLARRTAPGKGHVIFSQAELDRRVRDLLDIEEIAPPEYAALRRQLRNRLVHQEIEAPPDWGLKDPPWSSVEQLLGLLDDRGQTPVDRDSADELAKFGAATNANAVLDSFLSSLVAREDELGKLDPEEADRLGQRAARQVLASARWNTIVGDRLDTRQVTQLLLLLFVLERIYIIINRLSGSSDIF